MKHKSKFDELISLYSLGVLDGDELQELEEHLRFGCKSCRKLQKETDLVLSLLAYSLEDIPLSPNLREKVFSEI